jgi:putative membrane protein
MAESANWQRISPFGALFYLGQVYEAIARNAVQSLAPLAAFMVAVKGDPVNRLLIGGGAFVLVTLALAFLNYWFFRYRITENSILIRQGVLKKKQLDIKFERVQAVNTRQNVLYRLLGLVTVSFDTAGSSAQEGHLAAVPLQTARELRDRIRRAPSNVVVEQPQLGDAVSAPPLLRLSAGDMVKIGLSSTRVFLLLVLIGPIGEYVSQEFGERIEESAVMEALGAVQVGLASGLAFAMVLTLSVIVVLLCVSIVGAFLRYYRYELVADEDVLRSSGGLLTRHEQSVNRTKVQSLNASQNVMLRVFGRFRLRARQASSSRGGRRSDFIVPLCTRDTLAELSSEVFPQEFSDLTLDPRSVAFVNISPYFLRSRIVIAGLLPALAALVALWHTAGAAASLVLLWIPVCGLGVWRIYRRYGVMYGHDGLSLRSGFIGYRVTAWLHRKVQRISITQSPLQRRKRLATVRIHLAAGPPVKIPFLDYTTALQLRDYVLYRVESSQQAWH